MLKRRSAEQPFQHVESLVQNRRTLLRIGHFAEAREARVPRVAESDAQNDPAVGELIERDVFAGELPRPPTWSLRPKAPVL